MCLLNSIYMQKLEKVTSQSLENCGAMGRWTDTDTQINGQRDGQSDKEGSIPMILWQSWRSNKSNVK